MKEVLVKWVRVFSPSSKFTLQFELLETLFIGEELPHLGGPRVVHPHGAVHELHPIGFASLDDGVELSSADGDRLLE